MPFQINSGLDTLSILSNLNRVNNEIATSVKRLSTGLRINSAADDPTGFLVANSYETQIDSLNQAISNTQDSASLVKTASSALSEISSLLSSIRSSALNAAANINTNPAVAQAEQLSIQNALSSINSIAGTTQYGNKSLLNGSAGVLATVSNATLSSGVSFGGQFGGGVTQAGNVTITVANIASRAQAVGGSAATYASVNATIATVNGGTTGTGGNVTINGQTITVTGSDTVQSLINAINNISATTGVSAAANTANGSTSITLSQQKYGANFHITTSESAALVIGTTGTSVTGTNATVTVQAQTLINGNVTTVTTTFVGGRGSTDSGLRVTDTYGNSILLTEAGNTTGTSNAVVASVTSNPVSFQVGANLSQTLSTTFPNVFASNLGNTSVSGSNLSTLDVTTSTGASNGLLMIDEAISQVSKYQAQLGSFQKNVLTSSVNVLTSARENMQAALSRVRDVDVASETTRLAKLEVLQQAGVSVLRTAQNIEAQYLRLLS